MNKIKEGYIVICYNAFKKILEEVEKSYKSIELDFSFSEEEIFIIEKEKASFYKIIIDEKEENLMFIIKENDYLNLEYDEELDLKTIKKHKNIIKKILKKVFENENSKIFNLEKKEI